MCGQVCGCYVCEVARKREEDDDYDSDDSLVYPKFVIASKGNDWPISYRAGSLGDILIQAYVVSVKFGVTWS